MPITVVRQATTIDSSSNVASPAFTGTPTVGNDIVAVLKALNGSGDPTITTLVDNASGGSNTYANQRTDTNSGWAVASFVWRAKVVSTLSNLTLTATLNTNSVVGASAIEVEGLTQTPLDVVAGTNADTTSPWTVATGALGQADELIIASFASPMPTQNNAITIDSWGGTATQIFINDGAGANSYGAAAYRVVSSASTVTVSFSANNNGNSASCVSVATYRQQYTPSIAKQSNENHPKPLFAMRYKGLQ